jgi:hypothetical protein
VEVVDLKTELLKKKEEYEREKQQGVLHRGQSNKKPTLWGSKNKGVEERIARDRDKQSTEAIGWDKMQEIMKQKAALYDKLHSGEATEDSLSAGQRENLLIDFSRKDLPAKCPEESEELTEWVEIIDEFGRTRMVTKAAAESMQQEEDTKNESSAPAGPSHYDATKEIRTKGVGFFQFAAEEEQRSVQLTELQDMRQDTVQMREQSEKVQLERKHKLEERLRKVKERRQKLAGQSAIQE